MNFNLRITNFLQLQKKLTVFECVFYPEINDEVNEISMCLQNEEVNSTDLRREFQQLKKEQIDINTEINLLEDETTKINISYTSDLSNDPMDVSSILPQNFEKISSINNLSSMELEDKLKDVIIECGKITSKINFIESALKNNFYILRNELKQAG
ncbi:hypothetical protein HZS_5326 [Henneguya salminicola]|nr:hypothetical protein HZS_5326 [Henneguya salminicola]